MVGNIKPFLFLQINKSLISPFCYTKNVTLGSCFVELLFDISLNSIAKSIESLSPPLIIRLHDRNYFEIIMIVAKHAINNRDFVYRIWFFLSRYLLEYCFWLVITRSFLCASILRFIYTSVLSVMRSWVEWTGHGIAKNIKHEFGKLKFVVRF